MAKDIGPGSLVRMVNDDWDAKQAAFIAANNLTAPIRGRVYRVRRICDRAYSLNLTPEPGLLLDEIRNKPVAWEYGNGEPSFTASRFVPIDDDALSVFRGVERRTPAPDDLVEV